VLIIKLMSEGGISYMRYSISNTAEYGDLTRGPRLVTEQTKAEMKKILTEIQDGSFAKEWLAECKNGKPNFNKLYEADKNHQIEVVGRKLRKMFVGWKPRKCRKTNSVAKAFAHNCESGKQEAPYMTL